MAPAPPAGPSGAAPAAPLAAARGAAPAAPAAAAPAADEDADLEAQAAALEAEAAREEEEERKKRVAAAWTAHKAPDGRVYYFNTETQQSSWTRPEGFRGDASGVAGLPVPVAQATIGDTGWVEVKCADGRRYWYQATGGQQTSWAEPPEVAEHKRRADAESMHALKRMRQQADEQRAAAQRQLAGTLGALGAVGGPGQAPTVIPAAGGGGMMAMASAEALRRMHIQQAMAARQAAGGGPGGMGASSKEARVAGFKALLADEGVNAFSFWDKVRPKLEKDARWQLLPSNKDRRAVFEEFCKNVAAEAKAARAVAERVTTDGFAALLEEAVALERRVAAEMEAAAAAAEEERRAAVAEDEERRRRQQEEGEVGEAGDGKGDGASAVAAPAGTGDGDVGGVGGTGGVRPPRSPGSIPEDELEGLAYSSLERYWGADERWAALEEPRRRDMFERRFGAAAAAAVERKKAAQQARVAAYHQLLRSLGVDGDTRWTPIAADVAAHPAGAALGPEEREELFRRFVDDLRDRKRAQEAAAAEEERRQADAEARLAAQGEEADKRRRRAEHGTAVASYKTLLAELVRDPGARYRDWRDKLARDSQGRASHPALQPHEYETLFNDHTAALEDAVVAAAKEALAPLLLPLLPPALVAAGEAARAAAKAASVGTLTAILSSGGVIPSTGGAAPEWPRVEARALAGPLRSCEALLRDEGAAAALEGDGRWARASEGARLRAWREWTEEFVWGRAPGAQAAAAGPDGERRAGGGGVEERGAPGPRRDRRDDAPEPRLAPRLGGYVGANPRERERGRSRERERRRSMSRSRSRSRERDYRDGRDGRDGRERGGARDEDRDRDYYKRRRRD